ncbi:hypothetical protein AMJ86_05735 [bacterium SM23_57]|nr:MAG: hypothetical protein AMJ86_05735 [bacterium SM23_57]
MCVANGRVWTQTAYYGLLITSDLMTLICIAPKPSLTHRPMVWAAFLPQGVALGESFRPYRALSLFAPLGNRGEKMSGSQGS